ncbi:MAG: acyl-[acyl-carrier-protein] thioesterase [Candidatus Aminicenantales bacterium]
MTDAIHLKKFKVRAVDIDQSGRIQPVIFLDYLLESASEQAGLFEVGVTDLFKKNRTWVLSRFHAEFERFPAWGEEVEIRTWPSAKLPLYAIRDFEASGERGPAVRATSSWLIIDLETRRPARTAEHLAGFPLLNRRAVEDDFPSLPALSREDVRLAFPVFFFDLDINRHFTATAYVHRALETVPREILFEYRPVSIEVNFRSEAFYGDTIVSRLERVDRPENDGRPVFLHRLSRAVDDKELTLLRTAWSKTPKA